VIARLKKERDEARSLLAQAERQYPVSALNAPTANAPVLSNGKRGFYIIMFSSFLLLYIAILQTTF